MVLYILFFHSIQKQINNLPFLFLFFINCFTDVASSVKVVSLQTDVWAAPSVDVYIEARLQGLRRQKNNSLVDISSNRNPPSVEALTACYRFKNSAFSQEEIHLSYAIPGVPNYLLACECVAISLLCVFVLPEEMKSSICVVTYI